MIEDKHSKYPRYKAPHHSGKDLDFATRCIHGGQYSDPYTGAVNVPIYATSTFQQEAPGVNRGFEYGREHNPTREALERALTDLDGGVRSFAFSSGLAAMASILDSLPAGSHVIASDDLYGGSYRMLDRLRKHSANIEASFVDMSDLANVEKAVRTNTKLLWVETPTNPFLRVYDLAALAAAAKKHKLVSVVDNTFATCWAQRPLDYGHDMVLYSLTKYINGHSDMIGGAVVVGDNSDYVEKLAFLQMAVGSILSPFDSYLALRGIKTLDVRLQRQNDSAMQIAAWLEKHPRVAQVYYPGLASHPQHELAKRQMRGFGGIVSVKLKGGMDETVKMLSACRIFVLAESLGAVESLVDHPASMTHASISREVREAHGLTDSLIRLSVGLENADDLIKDLDQALNA